MKNLESINEFRAAHGLAPLAKPAKSSNQASNQAKRGQESRDLKAKRGRGGK